MTIGIYCIRNIINNKRYIGSSANIEQRWRAHRHELRTKTHHSIHLQRAWDKYGENSFEFTVLSESVLETLIPIEQENIDLYKSHSMDYGYNMAPSASSCVGVKHSEEFRLACSKRNKNRYLDSQERIKTGIASKNSWTKENKEAASKRVKEAWADPDTKRVRSKLTSIGASTPARIQKRSDRMKEKWKSEEERYKASLASPHRKRIQHVETGMIYESVSEASRVLPISKQTIKNNLLGKFKSAKGMNFQYV